MFKKFISRVLAYKSKTGKMLAVQLGSLKNVDCCGLMCVIRNPEKEILNEIPIPLVSVSAIGTVIGAVAQVEITQVYVNKENEPIEAVYYFPLDSNAAVTHFHAELEGRILKGVVKPEEDAKAEYEEAVEQQITAFLAEESKPDFFKLQIGYLKPGCQVKIVLGYVTEVKNEKGSNTMRFFLPTTVAPRYIPPTETDPKGVDLVNMTFSEQTPAPMSIKVTLAIQGGIKSVESPTHEINVTEKGPVEDKKNWNRALVELNGQTTDMDRDFVLLVTPEELHTPRLYTERLDGEKGTVASMIHFIPSFTLTNLKTELIFLLDRSGSMQGSSIDLAKKALSIFLHSIPVDSYFNIIGFGSSFELLFPESVKYSDDTLKTAVKHSKELRADLGGTEILDPLTEIYSKPVIPGYLRQIFVLTDGEVSNTDQVIGLTKSQAHSNRVFSLGIGDSASHYLVEGIANAGGGTSAFVTYNESIDKKVLHQLKIAIQPALTDITVNWDGVSPTDSSKNPLVKRGKAFLDNGLSKFFSKNKSKESYQQCPREFPPIFDGSQLVLLGIFSAQVPTGVSITASTPDGPLSINIRMDEDNNLPEMSTGLLHKLAAVKIVRELELEISALEYSSSVTNSQEKELKSQIIDTACKNGIASKYTSFVVVDEANQVTKEHWVMQTRYVPSQLAHEWGGDQKQCGNTKGRRMSAMARFGGGLMSLSASQARPRMKSLRLCSSQMGGSLSSHRQLSVASCQSYFEAGSGDSVCLDGYSDLQVLDPLEEVISLQSFAGSFNLDFTFCSAIAKDLDALKTEAANNQWDETAWATSLALAYFSEKLPDRKDSWELVYGKGKTWVCTNFPKEADAMISAAKQCIRSSAELPNPLARVE